MLGNDVERFFTPEGVAAGYPATEMWLALETGHANDKRWHLRNGGDHAERDRMCEMSLDLLQVISLDGIVERINPAWTTIPDFAPRDMIASASETLLLLVSQLRYKPIAVQGRFGSLVHLAVRARRRCDLCQGSLRHDVEGGRGHAARHAGFRPSCPERNAATSSPTSTATAAHRYRRRWRRAHARPATLNWNTHPACR